jgi:hypothetical protein
MKLRIITEAYDKNLAEKLSQMLMIEPRALRQIVDNINPDLRYGTWILKQIKERASLFNPQADGSFIEAFSTTATKLKTALEVFDERKDEMPSQDVNAYSADSLITATEQLKPIEKAPGLAGLPGTRHLFSERDGDNLYEIYEISDPSTLCTAAEGSSWCVRQSYHAKSYLGRQSQVVVLKNGAATCLFAADLSEIKNAGNTIETRPEILRLVRRAGSILNRPDRIAARIINVSGDESSVIDFGKLVRNFIEVVSAGQATEAEMDSPQVRALLDPDQLDEKVVRKILSDMGVAVPYAETVLEITGKKSKTIEDYLAYAPDGRIKRQLNKFVGTDMGLSQLFNAIEYWRTILRPTSERYPQLEQAIISALDIKLLLGKHKDVGTGYVIEGIDEYVRKVLGGEWPEYYAAISDYATRYPHLLFSLAERCLWDMLTSKKNAVQKKMAQVYLKLIEDFSDSSLASITQGSGGLSLLLKLYEKIESANKLGLGVSPDILNKSIIKARPERAVKENSNTTKEILTRKKIMEQAFGISDDSYRPIVMVGTGAYKDPKDENLLHQLAENGMLVENGYFRVYGTDIMTMVDTLTSFLVETTEHLSSKPETEETSQFTPTAAYELLDYCVVGFTNGIEMAELVLTVNEDGGIEGGFGFISDTSDGGKYCHTWQPDRDNWQAQQLAFALPQQLNDIVTKPSFGRKIVNEFSRALLPD